MFFKRAKKTASGDLASSESILYVNSSEFVNYVSKDQISGPVRAQPMGTMDITACDVICSGIPSASELKRLRRCVRQTATALGIRVNRNIEQSILSF
ncbi:hypothetical protein IW140_000431 [Coemansia sp. RSA 1813]|nr:hypothetical protein EV178_000610 [Coemansia sp. RSA 1646]KAJ1773301.1 hypothetical protein LPJ74_000812 [Coemansia sp. RSA 1843]KAJ2092769.1 hypothetical protein IW138_000864 [Coemansia sp. RSA 986]KAJ2573032.1 hypothetical protein IW140_000431 [Coemansia sp. RSA 1813]